MMSRSSSAMDPSCCSLSICRVDERASAGVPIGAGPGLYRKNGAPRKKKLTLSDRIFSIRLVHRSTKCSIHDSHGRIVAVAERIRQDIPKIAECRTEQTGERLKVPDGSARCGIGCWPGAHVRALRKIATTTKTLADEDVILVDGRRRKDSAVRRPAATAPPPLSKDKGSTPAGIPPGFLLSCRGVRDTVPAPPEERSPHLVRARINTCAGHR